jgi:hypothetical protein
MMKNERTFRGYGGWLWAFLALLVCGIALMGQPISAADTGPGPVMSQLDLTHVDADLVIEALGIHEIDVLPAPTEQWAIAPRVIEVPRRIADNGARDWRGIRTDGARAKHTDSICSPLAGRFLSGGRQDC